jgi:GT2 family glycosyltransferase
MTLIGARIGKSKNHLTTVSTTNLPVRVIVTTKGSQQDFLEKSMTGQSLLACQHISPCQVRIFENNTRGLSETYNQAIDESKNNPAILIFVHDDVSICDYYWQQRVRLGLEKFQIVGVAGNTRRLPGQPGWIMINTNMQLDDYSYLSGAIGQDTQFPPRRVDVFGPPGQACKLLDGVFLAVRSDVLHQFGLRFDPIFKFHFYDLDFCRRAEQLGLSMGTIDLSLVHASLGRVDDVWQNSLHNYQTKWGN